MYLTAGPGYSISPAAMLVPEGSVPLAQVRYSSLRNCPAWKLNFKVTIRPGPMESEPIKFPKIVKIQIRLTGGGNVNHWWIAVVKCRKWGQDCAWPGCSLLAQANVWRTLAQFASPSAHTALPNRFNFSSQSFAGDSNSFPPVGYADGPGFGPGRLQTGF